MSNSLFPIYFIDAPQILDTSVTPIPGMASLPLQVVANTGTRAAYAINFIDTTGDWIGVFVGAIGNEKMVTIIGGGLNTITPVVIPANARVSLRSVTTSSITNGELTISFLGQGLYMGFAS